MTTSALSGIDYDELDQELASELHRTPVQPDMRHSELTRHAALTRVVDRHVAEDVGLCRLAGQSWAWIGGQLGVTAQAAQQRFGKLPPAPATTDEQHTGGCSTAGVHLRRDRTGWGCACGLAGHLN